MLVLFDIDGTLLSGATDAHRDALHAALRSVHGIEPDRARGLVAPAGRTDPEIARLILLDAGVSAAQIDERRDALQEECCRAYAELSTADLTHAVIPGIHELLESLSKEPEVTLSLLTGNYECVARLKLERAGIGRYFTRGQGGFGSDSEDRTALPAIARRRAGTPANPHPRDDTIVIGDTPRDIACARADGVRCIAVATGPHEAQDLRGADAVVADARGLRAALAELGQR